jgi:ribosomal protein S18 acetylase RimI-like enzyme
MTILKDEVSKMTHDESESKRTSQVRSYLIMKAKTAKALQLVEESWGDKAIPSYIHVRLLKKEELPGFVELYNRCFLASPDPFCPLSVDEAEQLELDGIFVAEMWDRLAGFIACFVEKDEDSFYGEITGIGVLPSRRRKGVATALIKCASEYFIDAGVDEIYCEVYEENIPSQSLILTYGFEKVGRREVTIHSTEAPEEDTEMPGKIMRRLGLRPRVGCEDCRDI